nr:AAA family ATPase [Comamonas jiangduensis]
MKNSYIRIFNDEDFTQFQNFAEHVKENKNCKLKNAIFIYQTRPISIIPKDEPFYNNGQIEQKIKIGKSHDVLRNKILKTENSQALTNEKFKNLEDRLKIIFNDDYTIKFKNKNRIDDEYIRINLKHNDQKELEISLMGSGFLQIVEIFSTLEYIDKNTDGVSLILIDEPDSHIHSDLQIKLIDELKKCTTNQVFIITHNDRLTSKALNGELFYLNKITKSQKTLTALPIEDYHKVKTELASVINSLNLEDKTPIVITEGKTDKKILEIAWQKLNPTTPQPFKIITSGIQIEEESRTGNAEAVRRTIEYLANITDLKIVGLFDNDREGNEQFKGLNGKVFSTHDNLNYYRKHNTKDVFGLILPPPEFRNSFVTPNHITQRYFVIEHYFSNQILEENNLKVNSILGTEVFEINNNNKTNFSDNLHDKNREIFVDFSILFAKIIELLQIN